jgi:site-specific DNA-methyltransferase (adenine-specific)
MTNRLYYGDNLEVLRNTAQFPDACVDLIYLDPPFNSNSSYNVLFRAPSGANGGNGTDASIEAFDDTWQWGPAAEDALADIRSSGNHKLWTLLDAIAKSLGKNALMAYLAMMAVRLIELHRVLKDTGSLYLHCDPTASHYLKLVLDAMFGAENFRCEIVWKRTFAHGNVGKNYGDVTDTIFFYSASKAYTWNQPFKQVKGEKAAKKYPNVAEDGRRWQSVTLRNPGVRPNLHYPFTASDGVTYQPHPNGWSCNLERLQKYDAEGRLHFPSKPDGALRLKMFEDESAGERIQSLWDDIPPIGAQAAERLGYPTQKPRALLERIVATSSNPGDVVLDPFCGCGTAVDAAEKLGRRWVGIDITHLAIGLIEKRMHEGYDRPGDGFVLPFEVVGVPKDKDSALRLAAEKPHDFQNWFCLKVGGYPLDGGRKGADRGVDGHFYPYENSKDTSTGVISVKAGTNIGVAMIRDLRGVMEREGYPFALFLSAYEPTKPMVAEAAAAGTHENEFGRFQRLQILTPADLFHGPGAKLPPLASINRRHARVETRASHKAGGQGELL